MNQDIRDTIEEVVKEAQNHKAEIMEAVNDKIESDKDLFKFFSRVEAGAGEDGRKKLIAETLEKFRKWGNSKGGRVELDKAELRAIEEFGEVEDLLALFAIGGGELHITQKQRDRIFRKLDKLGHRADLRHALACHNTIDRKIDDYTTKKLLLHLFSQLCATFTTLYDTQKSTEELATKLVKLISADKQGEVDKAIAEYNEHTRPYGTLQRTEAGDIEDIDKNDSLMTAETLAKRIERVCITYLTYQDAFREFIAENKAIRYLDSYTKGQIYDQIDHSLQMQDKYIKRKGEDNKEAVVTAYEELRPDKNRKNNVKKELLRIKEELASTYK